MNGKTLESPLTRLAQMESIERHKSADRQDRTGFNADPNADSIHWTTIKEITDAIRVPLSLVYAGIAFPHSLTHLPWIFA